VPIAARLTRAWRALTGPIAAPIRRRAFAGAAVNRLTASLQGYSLAINADLDNALVILRSRARQLCANHEYGRRFLTLVEDNLIGNSGPTLQVRAMMSNGRQLDKSANAAIEMHWWRWGKVCDIRGVANMATLLQIVGSSAARDGEILIRLVRGKDLPYGLQLQLLEADRLDEALNQTLSNGNRIRMGVEVDSRLKPVAYWIKTAHPGENYTADYRIERERVPAADIIHVYRPMRAEQVRGYTWMHAVLMRSAMLQGYEEAAVVAARVGAAKMGIFTREEGASKALVDGLGDAVDTSGNLQISAEAGEFFETPPGVKLESWDPDYPHQNFESFMNQCLRGLSAGVDVAAHNLSMNMTQVNYSSARIAELSERETWKKLQGWFIHQVCRRIYVEWLKMGLLLGQITLLESGKPLPAERLQKFIDGADFQGRRWAWVDPSKEIGAAKESVDLKVNSRTQIAAENGRDFDEVVAELEQEDATLKKAGLNTAPAAPAKPAAQEKPDPDEEEDPEKETP